MHGSVEPSGDPRAAQNGLNSSAALASNPAAGVPGDVGDDGERAAAQRLHALEAALQAGRMGTWDWTIRTGRVEWSEGLEAIHDRVRGSFRGTVEDALSDIHPEDRERVMGQLRAAIEDGQEYHTTYRIVGQSRQLHWLEARGVVRRSADGQAEGMTGVCCDITARLMTERALNQSEAKYRQLLQSLPLAVYTCDVQGRVTLYNDAAAELWGRKPVVGEARWCGSKEILDLAGRPIAFEDCPMAMAMRTGRAVRGQEVLVERPDGTRRNVLPHPEPLFDEAGQLVGVVNMLVDITAIREAERAISLSEARFRLMADASPTLIWITGTDKRCNWFNKPWLEFRGREMEQEIEGGWLEGVHPDDVERAGAEYCAAFEARRVFSIEYRLRRADGVYRWMLDVGRPLEGPGGAFTGYIGSCVDITDQVLARQSLERQQSLLEEAVTVRTQELQRSNERLRIAERMAALGTLSAGLGHDMGNLLVPVRVRLESLSQADLPAELQADVEAIGAAAAYLQRLAGGLRLLAVDPTRVNQGTPTDLAGWWEEAQPLMRNVLPRGIKLEADLGGVSLRIAMPRAILTQVVFNLVQNAGDALRARGHGTVRVRAAARGEGKIALSVSDDGPGMPSEVRLRCMEPYFTTKSRGISTGLGLALVYGLVEEAGGSVSVESLENEGTGFELLLPAAEEAKCQGGVSRGLAAVVQIKDVRIRAIVTAELKSLAVEVVGQGGDGRRIDFTVLDECPPGVSGLGLAGSNGGGQIVVLGPRPAVQHIRRALAGAVQACTDAAAAHVGRKGRDPLLKGGQKELDRAQSSEARDG